MSQTELIEYAPAWFAFGAVIFLGGYTAYRLLRSRIIQTLVIFVGSMVFGVLAMSGLAMLLATILN